MSSVASKPESVDEHGQLPDDANQHEDVPLVGKTMSPCISDTTSSETQSVSRASISNVDGVPPADLEGASTQHPPILRPPLEPTKLEVPNRTTQISPFQPYLDNILAMQVAAETNASTYLAELETARDEIADLQAENALHHNAFQYLVAQIDESKRAEVKVGLETMIRKCSEDGKGRNRILSSIVEGFVRLIEKLEARIAELEG